jgi:glutaredoxin
MLKVTLLQSPGCPYCQRLSAIWPEITQALTREYPDMVSASHNLDTDGPHKLLKPGRGVPQVAIEVDGKHVDSLVGYRPADAMVAAIKSAAGEHLHSSGGMYHSITGSRNWTMWWAMVSLLTIIVAFIMWVYSSINLNGMLKLDSTVGNPELKTAADFGTATAVLLPIPVVNVVLASLFTARTGDLMPVSK